MSRLEIEREISDLKIHVKVARQRGDEVMLHQVYIDLEAANRDLQRYAV